MIKYSLKCSEDDCNKREPFDGWFQNSISFEKQIKAGYISCPYCGSLKIRKNLMSPSVKSIKGIKPEINSKNVKHDELYKKTRSQVDMMVVFDLLEKVVIDFSLFISLFFLLF